MLERGISVVAAEGVRAMWVAVVNTGTRENEIGEEGLALMPVAALTD